MNRRILLTLLCALPLTLFSQAYRYTKENRVEYNGKTLSDTVYALEAEVKIDVQITKNTVTVTRNRNGAGEPLNIDRYTIKSMRKGDTQTKITTSQGYTFIIYHVNQSIGLYYKNNSKRLAYSFYNGTNKPFLYEQQ